MNTPPAFWMVLVAAIFVGSVGWGQEAPRTNAPMRLTVIKYCLEPFGTFEIVGTDVNGVKKLGELTKALRNHKERNPAAKYEVLAEIKSTPEGEKAIVEAIVGAGITLEHYWAAHSSWAPGTPVSPHGIGYVDHIDRYKRPDNEARQPTPGVHLAAHRGSSARRGCAYR